MWPRGLAGPYGQVTERSPLPHGGICSLGDSPPPFVVSASLGSKLCVDCGCRCGRCACRLSGGCYP